MNELLECPICNNQYNNDEYIPKFIECGNGHTICLMCCTGIFEKHQNEKIQCPFDNEIVYQSPLRLQTNLIVLQMLDNISNSELRCTQHNEIQNIYCNRCQMQICYKCVIYSDHKNHEVAEVKDIYQDYYQQVDSIYNQIQAQKNQLQQQIQQFDHQKQKLKNQVLDYQEDVECQFDSLVQTLNYIKDQRLKQIKEESDKIINSFEEANIAIQKRVLQMINVQKPEKTRNFESANIETLIQFLIDQNVRNLAFKSALPQVNYNFKYQPNQEFIIDHAYKNLYSFQLSMHVQQAKSQQNQNASLASIHDDIFNKNNEQSKKTKKHGSKKQSNSEEYYIQPSDLSPSKQFNKGYQLIEQLKQKQQKNQSAQKPSQKQREVNISDIKPTRRKKTMSNMNIENKQTVTQNKNQNQRDQSPKFFKTNNKLKENTIDDSCQRIASFEVKLFNFETGNIIDRSNTQQELEGINENQKLQQQLQYSKIKQKSPKLKIQKRPFTVELILQESYATNSFLPGENLQLVWNIKNTGTMKLPSCTRLIKVWQRDQNQRETETYTIGEIEPQENSEVFVFIEAPNNVGNYIYEFQVFIDENKLGAPQNYTVKVTKDFLLITDKKYTAHLNFYNQQSDKKPFKLLFEKRNVECFWQIYDEGWCNRYELGDIIKHVIVAEGDFNLCQADLRQKDARMNIVPENYAVYKEKFKNDNKCHIF